MSLKKICSLKITFVALEAKELYRYETLGRTNTLEETVTLALKYEAMLKMEKIRHRRFVRTTQVH